MAFAYLVPLAGGDPIPIIKDSVIVGRRPECDIRLEIPNVSGRHAELRLHRGNWHVIDLQSANGTKVNGDKVKKKRLSPGDEVVFARTNRFKIEFDPVAAAQVAMPRADAAARELGGAKETTWDKSLRRGRKRADKLPTVDDLDSLDAEEEKEHAFKKSLLEKAGLAKSDKPDVEDVFDDDLDALEELEEMIEEPAPKPKKKDD